ncbi:MULTISPECIES: glycoside hydrolase family 57 protein [unclassified Methylophaga]|jgi:alpha-amylase/alpha-mannosidase (GH57 family)|uniref:glycoside hydrolase family 57 protein n=1 Tax=unclassified Methylophaga TaxID=2629249 RepID=UPI000C89F140|nr:MULTISPECIES: glycoside hydrolase family 57 protein [unclassified Methylophaga]MAY16649.1 glycoside hydrolase [Methylophaga sp.]MBN46260.1 glycoside hydrolase [Methylophaga sp.]HAO25055.1 glycoside hydrolase [Methylophaga sp.]HCD04723.1 glycoside hydrolase [Methylophaga sp.]|tara:strand:- start:7867 stop:9549 length:1683 start_codon:yes stop_codon:yes gene_type:complete
MSDKLKVVLCWHMHQPQYSEPMGGSYQLPWTYLHAIKDYVDMAWHLEQVPDARAVVNFAPTLLEQIDDYDQQLKGRFKGTGCLKDPLLIALDSPVQPAHIEERQTILNACLRANDEKLIAPFPVFAKLAEMARWVLEDKQRLAYLNDQFLVDMLVWYHLVWMGESVRRNDVRIQTLMKKGQQFNFHDRRQLMIVIGELLSDLIPRYRRLAEAKKVELSVTPYAHPIVPLLLDINSTLEAMPDALLPQIRHYPGGESRTDWHMEKGLAVFESFFGFRPQGCWPSEGAVSKPTIESIAKHGFQWTASGENVLRNSLNKSDLSDSNIHKPYQLEGKGPACFFRDDGLSDLIGFTYTKWSAEDAVNDFIHHLTNIKATTEGDPDRVVSVILDGENAWEHYSYNGFYFLQSLYKQLSRHPEFELTTFAECLEKGCKSALLPEMVAGSWVYGTFSTWIGDVDKNRAWDLLSQAKQVYDTKIAEVAIDDDMQQAIDKQLAICEGSDWFWWFGDYNAADSVSDFERLFRLHLSNLYQMLGVEVPQILSEVVSSGGGEAEQGGTMRRGG